jgi:transglutaminase-like putative cysteine protease
MPVRLVLCLMLLFACGRLAAADDATDHAIVIERHWQHFTVAQDGSHTLDVELVKSIVSPSAVEQHAEQYVSFNGSLDQLVSIEAWTTKPDGRRVPVAPEQIRDQQEAASADAPMFQDTRLKVVIFPGVQAGDTLTLRYTVRRHTPLFPGHFEDFTVARPYRHKDFRLTYDLPASMTLQADAVGFVPVASAGAPGRKRYSFRYVDGPNEGFEQGAVSYLDYGRRLAVSTFPDYAAFARAYHARAAVAAVPDAAIAKLAAEITQGRHEPRDKAIALSDWVRRNIRYVAVYLGPGGVVPHPASSVLANRYGDCKDHTVLLQALLAAAGIPSSAALVNGDDAYRLPAVPTLGVLNHVIVHVPQLQLFLDPSAGAVAGGFLPPALLGKPVLLADSGGFAVTPVFQPARSRTTTRFDIARDGSSRFHVSRSNGGAMAEPYRHAVRATPQADRDGFVRRMLAGLGQTGDGLFEPGETEAQSDSSASGSSAGDSSATEGAAGKAASRDGALDNYTLAFSGATDGFVRLPGPVALASTYNFWGGLGDALAELAREPERRHDFVCPAIDAEDELRYALPPRTRVLALPKPLVVDDGRFFYRSQYVRENATVVVKRRLQFRHTAATCTPDDYRQMRPALERMMRDLRGQVVVQGH